RRDRRSPRRGISPRNRAGTDRAERLSGPPTAARAPTPAARPSAVARRAPQAVGQNEGRTVMPGASVVSVRMAVEAGVAVVLIARDCAVLVVHVGLVVLVAKDAFEDGVVGGIYVAIAAHVPLVFVLAGIDREILRVMVPVGGRPGCGGVARLTLSREQRRGVVRIRRVIVGRLVTAKAV